MTTHTSNKNWEVVMDQNNFHSDKGKRLYESTDIIMRGSVAEYTAEEWDAGQSRKLWMQKEDQRGSKANVVSVVAWPQGFLWKEIPFNILSIIWPSLKLSENMIYWYQNIDVYITRNLYACHIYMDIYISYMDIYIYNYVYSI